MKDRNVDLSKSTVASHMTADGTLDSKGRRILAGLGRSYKLAGAAAQVEDDAAEEPVKKGNPKKGNKTKLDEDDEEVKVSRS